MRISDGSSDVCSSDLATRRASGGREALPRARHSRSRAPSGPAPRRQRLAVRQSRPHFGTRRGRPTPLDRKSVVSGKRVSVRVDLGGRRSIKKKNNKKYIRTKTTTLN